ncbi:hypothetical protein RV15_GL002812 [Enterococcus silesiacus]|nr:hypothetical protein RV15_GL002812 [Enterococcus silesiacus]
MEIVETNGEKIQLLKHEESVYSEEITHHVKKITNDPFRLQDSPLFRVSIIEGNDGYICIICVHHIISDGVSMGIFQKKLVTYYQNILDGTEFTFDVDQGYSDFVLSENEYLKNGKYNKHKNFWHEKTKGMTPVDMLADFIQDNQNNGESNEKAFSISDELFYAVQEKSKELEITVFQFFFACFYVLIHKYTNQERVTLTTPFSHRPSFDLLETIGCFIYTLPISILFDRDISFSDLSKELYEEMLLCYKNTGYPNNLIARDQKSNMDGPSIFDFSFVYDFFDEEINGSCKIQNLFPKNVTFPGTMMAILHNSGETKEIKLQYKTDYFSDETIELLGRRFLYLLESIVNDCDQIISEISILQPSEENSILKMVESSPETINEYSDMKEVIEKRLAENPQSIALIGKNYKYTCKEINDKANFLAKKIVKQTNGGKETIAIQARRSPELVIAVFAVIKAGCSYLPIDIDYPEDRKAFIFKDSDVRFLLNGEKLPYPKVDKVEVYEIPLIGDMGETENLDITRKETDLLYVEYTSGSTGQPKGVLIEDHSAINVLEALDGKFPMEKEDVYCFKTAFSFDISGTELYGWIIGKGALFILEEGAEKDSAIILNSIKEYNITHINFVPSMFRLFLENVSSSNKKLLNSLKWIFLGGEAVTHEVIEQFLLLDTSIKLENVYGPTESTMWVAHQSLREKVRSAYIPIGKPLNQTRLYILNTKQELQPIGIPGELCIAGTQVARGYKKHDVLNQKLFIDNPYYDNDDEESYRKMYRTGDKARMLADGSIEYINRMDQQVKIGGVRIELGEIENTLEKIEGIIQAVVIVKSDNTLVEKLCAYYLGEELDLFFLRKQLGDHLPSYMIPALFIHVAELPYNNSGKVDRKYLETLNIDQKKNQAIKEMPKKELEKLIFKSWEEVLGFSSFGIDDNFVHIGGHSLALIQVHNKLKKQLQIEFPITDLLEMPTIRLLAEKLNSGEASAISNRKSFFSQKKFPQSSDIAIIGLSVNVPGSETIIDFWKNLVEEKESLHFYTNDELRELGIDETLINNPDYVKSKGRINNLDTFDSEFFDYSPSEVQKMSPQLRILYKGAWEAFEDAGHIPQHKTSKTGIFIGGSDDFEWYKTLVNSKENFGNIYERFTLSTNHFFATRLAYKFNITGPVFSALTGCSTTLVTTHLACQSLILGECDVALAGGITVELPNEGGYLYKKGMMFSPDGHCRPFDQKAEGTVFSNGMGLVVLKRADEAYQDGDHIYAVIKGSAINNDGSQKIGFTAPSVKGQVEVIQEAYKRAEIDPETVSYVEAHGTGTALGDPIEVQSLTEAFASSKKGFCTLGSVKGNIGHTDTAAGVVGLIKAAMVLKKRFIPATINYEEANQKIQFETTPFQVKSKGFRVETERLMRAGINSFGVGGTNAHMVLEEALDTQQVDESPNNLFVVSGKTKEAVRRNIDNILNYTDQSISKINLSHAAWTLQKGRLAFPYRYSFVINRENFNLEELLKKAVDVQITQCSQKEKLYFMFSGQGSQYQGMLRELFENSSRSTLGAVYQSLVLECFSFLEKEEAESIQEIIFGTEEPEKINQTEYTQLALFITEYSLAKLLMTLGIQPKILVGHSIGELVAATIAEVWTLEDGIKIIKKRGEVMQKQQEGSMLAVMANYQKFQHLLPENCYLSLRNTTDKCVVGGPKAAIEQLKDTLSNIGITVSVLKTSHAFHTPMMQKASEEFDLFIKEIVLNEPKIPIVSNLSGDYVKHGEMTNSSYWSKHITQTVYFEQSLTQILSDAEGVYIEIGPGNTLSSFLRQHEQQQQQVITNLVRHPKENKRDEVFLLEKIGYLWRNGVEIDWDGLSEYENRRKISLPTYSFEKSEYPITLSKHQVTLSTQEAQKKTTTTSILTNNLTDLLIESYQIVFGFKELSKHDDFFELGGDSLKAASLASIVEDEYGIKLEISDIFDHPKIEKLAQFLENNSSSAQDCSVIEATQNLPYYTLSTAQKRMFMLQMLEKDTTSYNLSSATFIYGNLDHEKVNKVIAELINRHSILKTSFEINGSSIVQKVATNVYTPFVYQDNSHQNLSIQEMNEKGYLKREIDQFVQPFQLKEAPLLRAKLIQVNAKEQILLFDVHHIAADGTSMEIIAKEFNQLYLGIPLEQGLQYKDYAVWEKENLISEELQKQKHFWLKQLEGDIPVLQMPLDYVRPEKNTFGGNRFYFMINPTLSAQIKEFSQKNGVTLYITMLCAWFILLAKYSGQKELIVGSPVSGRSQKDTRNIVGMFINMLPIKASIDSNLSSLEMINQVKERVLNAFQNQDYPFDQLVEDLNIPRTLNRNAVFDVCFDFQNMDKNELKAEGARFVSYDMPIETTSYDLVMTCQENIEQNQLEGFVDYATALFAESTILEMVANYEYILEQIVSSPKAPIETLKRFSNPHEAGMSSISAIFESKAARIKEKDALILSNGRKISYEEFNSKANQLARKLRISGISQGDMVGLIVGRDEYLMIAMVAVLKLGAAYVPIDPSFPRERIEYMIEHSETKVIISRRDIIDDLKLEVDYLDYEHVETLSDFTCEAAQNLLIQVSNTSLCYVIYTSGTTGRPKGVMVSQASVLNFIQDVDEQHIFDNENDKVFSLTTNSFDIFGFESLVSLCLGHTVYIASEEEQLDARLAGEKILKYQLTHILSTVSRIKAMVENKHFQPALKQLTCILSGGENYPLSLMHFLQESTQARIFNMYGPSETTIWSTTKDLTHATQVTIGKPIKNTEIFILDSDNNSVATGFFGELCISGSGLAIGYKNNKEENEKRFIRLNDKANTRIYKTGDRARLLENGEIELAGRLDEQVKIRGYRIELSEIEKHLQAHPLINQVVIKVFENDLGTEYLVAFYTVKTTDLDDLDLKSWLKKSVPEYMLPAKYINLKKFPILPNGKIDKNQLTVKSTMENLNELNQVHSLKESVIERSQMENNIRIIWKEVLNLETVGLEDNFFDSGGSSLGLMLVNNQLVEKLNLNTSLLDLFEHPTINSLVNFLYSSELQEEKMLIIEEKKADSFDNSDKRKEDIAIIGMSGHFPKGETIQEFWEQLVKGEEMLHHFTDEELNETGISQKMYKQSNYINAKGYLKGTEYFDSQFFGYSEKEARLMDPQIRMLHEIVWQALESAGYDPFQYEDKIGLFSGSSTNVSWLSQFFKEQQDSMSGFELLTLNDKDFFTTKVSYKLNLKGPSMNIQTACSTSLVAIHQAKESLLRGECEIAIAGGVSITYPQKEGYLWQPGMIFSRDGHCCPFSDNASGTVSGNGGGVVVLKRLSAAEKDGDMIHAVIKGSAINNDGLHKVGYTAPSISGQKEVIQTALEDAKLSSEQITYVETHGTGTELGDPIEFEALKQAFSTSKRNYCSLGAVKANIGHLDAAAGVAGFIKTVLVLKNKIVPPLINFENANEKISFEDSPFKVDKTSRKLSDVETIYAGVSSFGIGGTNVHVVIGSYDSKENVMNEEERESKVELFTFSGKTPDNMKANQQSLFNYLNKNKQVSITQVAQQLQKKAAFNYRGFQIINEHKGRITTSEFESAEKEENISKLNIVLLEGTVPWKEITQFFEEQKEKPFGKVYSQAFQEIIQIQEQEKIEKTNRLLSWAVQYAFCKALQKLGIQGKYHAFSPAMNNLCDVLKGNLTLKESLLKLTQVEEIGSLTELTSSELPLNSYFLVFGTKDEFLSLRLPKEDAKKSLILNGNKKFQSIFYEIIGNLWMMGYPMNFQQLHASVMNNIELPTYSFSKIAYPNDIVSSTHTEFIEQKSIESNKTDRPLTDILHDTWKEVLGINDCHAKDDFFELGGHSLSAIMLCSRINQEMAIELTVSEVFDNSGFEEMTAFVQQKLDGAAGAAKGFDQITKVEEQIYYDATYAQKRMYAAQKVEEERLAYNLGSAYYIYGEIKLDRLQETFQQLVDRHESFRTSFAIVDGDLKQFIAPNLTVKLTQEYILESDIDQKVSELIVPFKLSTAPLIRMNLLSISEQKHLLVIDMHHIISDQSSIHVLLKEFQLLYQNESLAPLEIQYKDFAVWQKNYLDSENYRKDLAYWKKELSGELESLAIPFDFRRTIETDRVGKNLLFDFSEELNLGINKFSKENGFTPYMIIFSTLQLLFWKYSSQEDFVLGTAVSGRSQPILEAVVGMFVNTLAIRSKINSSATVNEHMEETKKTLLQSFKHQDCQFDLLVEELKLRKTGIRNPLFDIMINYINMGTDELELESMVLEPYEFDSVDSKFDLTLTIIEKSGHFTFEAEYDSSLFKEEAIFLLGKRFIYLLEQMIKNTSTKLNELSITTPEDTQLIKRINETQTKAPIKRAIISLIEEWAHKTPDKVALRYKDRQIFYGELNERANQFARLLLSKGVKKGDRIGILIERGPLQIISILGIIKLGGVYVPIDVDFPRERITHMLKDSQAIMCITNSTQASRLSEFSSSIIIDDEKVLESFGNEPLKEISLSGDDDLYVIYTSGSSGLPKGVLVQNRSVVRVVHETNYIQIASEDVFLQLSNYAFDGSVFDIFGALSHGATLVLIDQKETLDIQRLSQVIKENQVTEFFMTASLFNMFVDWELESLQGLKFLCVGGEALSVDHVRRALDVLDDEKLINGYGPTETTVFACCHRISTVEDNQEMIPIGRPISNTNCYVLDSFNNILPMGIVGELCIGGVGLSSGYLNRDELSREKFISIDVDGEKINVYKTGDLASFDSNGVFNYLGRNDEQVKIRGYRIELGEVEAKLRMIDGISDVRVVTEIDAYGSTKLIAYYIVQPSIQIEKETMISLLKKTLPYYMIPSDFIRLASFPLTHNGKLDKQKIKQSKSISSEHTLELVDNLVFKEELGTSNNHEIKKELVLRLMRKVLDYPELTETDDFFECGGESIKAISLSQELKNSGYPVKVNEIFQYSTVKDLLKLPCFLEENKSKLQNLPEENTKTRTSEEIKKIDWNNLDIQMIQLESAISTQKTVEEFSLSACQQLHLNRGYQESGFIYDYYGDKTIEELQDVIWQIVESQQLLKSRLIEEKRMWQEVDIKTLKNLFMVSIPVIDLSVLSTKDKEYEGRYTASKIMRTPYRKKGFLWRCLILKLSSSHYQVIWGLHHLIFDGMSLEILKSQLDTYLMDRSVELKNPTKYSAYVQKLSELPKITNEKQVNDTFLLEEWGEETLNVVKQVNDSLKQLKIRVPLLELSDDFFNEALELIKSNLKPVFNKLNVEKLPMGLLQYGREIEESRYFDCVGEFLDIVPIFLERKDSQNNGIKEKLIWIKKHPIHFLTLFFAKESINQQLKQVFEEMPLPIILLNFQGYVSSDEKKAYQSFSEEDELHENNLIAKLIITVNFDEEYLYIESQ